MADDRTLKGPQDRRLVNISEDYEVRYWAEKFVGPGKGTEDRRLEGRRFSQSRRKRDHRLMAEITRSEGIVPALPCNDHFTPEARRLCARLMHKSELTDDETLMLALAAAQAALARYFQPGERSAEEALEAIGAVLDHEDVEAALQRKMRQEEARAHQMTGT
jgi:hypothetical protein